MGYLTELECNNKQEIKNFRTGALLGSVRDILDELEPYMEFLALCEEGKIAINRDQLPHVIDMMREMTNFYTWAIEEVKLKNQRLALMDIESQWKIQSD